MIRQRNVEKKSSFRASGVLAMIWRNISGLNKLMIVYLLLVFIILLYMKSQHEQNANEKLVRLNDYVSNMVENKDAEQNGVAHVLLNVKDLKAKEVKSRDSVKSRAQDSEIEIDEVLKAVLETKKDKIILDNEGSERRMRIMRREIKNEEEETDAKIKEDPEENKDRREVQNDDEDIVPDVEEPKRLGPLQLEVDHLDTEAGSLQAKPQSSKLRLTKDKTDSLGKLNSKLTSDDASEGGDVSIRNHVEKSKSSETVAKGKMSEVQNELHLKDDGFVLPVEKVGKQSKSASRNLDANDNSKSVYETAEDSGSVAKRNSLLSKLRSNSKSKVDSNSDGKLSQKVMARGKNYQDEAQRNAEEVFEKMMLPVEKIGGI